MKVSIFFNWTDANALNPKENEIRLTLFRYHDTDDFDHEHETYRQNVFRVEYKNNDV